MRRTKIDRLRVLALANDRYKVNTVKDLAKALKVHENTLYQQLDSHEWSRKTLDRLINYLDLDSVEQILKIEEVKGEE